MSPDLNAEVDDLVKEVINGKPLEEVIDSYINTATTLAKQQILEEMGDTDLSIPEPDLRLGWSSIRSQLAYNALNLEVVRRLKNLSPKP